jgi:hypothetical protein
MTRLLWMIAAIVMMVVVLSAAPVSAQCAMCRRALLSPEGQQLVAAFRGGILFLLAAPFASFAVVAFLAVRMQRRRGHRNPAHDEAHNEGE